MDYCITALSPLFTPKVYAALAASHYVFLKEVPIGSDYVIETRTAGWGEKWSAVIPPSQHHAPSTQHADDVVQVLHCVRVCHLPQEGLDIDDQGGQGQGEDDRA